MTILDPQENREELLSEDEEIGIGKSIRNSPPNWFKGFLTVILLIVLVVGSFWVSFLLGKQLLVPLKPAYKEMVLPTPEAAVAPQVSSEAAFVFERTQEAAPIPVVKPAPLAARTAPQPALKPKPKIVITPMPQHYYKVQAGAFKNKENAQILSEKMKSDGFENYIYKKGGLYRIQVGAYDQEDVAQELMQKLKEKGFEATLIIE